MQQKQQHNRVSCIKAILPLLTVVQADARMQILLLLQMNALVQSCSMFLQHAAFFI